MKQLIFFTAGIYMVLYAPAQNYTASDEGSAVKFSIKNFGLNVTGKLTGLKVKINFCSSNPAAASFAASIDAGSVNTGSVSRDNHLKEEEYFYVKKYPHIDFMSISTSPSSTPGELLMEGTITIKGVSKKIKFPFAANFKNNGYLFEGQFKLNRRDFGVGGSSLILSDNLTVSLSVFAKKADGY